MWSLEWCCIWYCVEPWPGSPELAVRTTYYCCVYKTTLVYIIALWPCCVYHQPSSFTSYLGLHIYLTMLRCSPYWECHPPLPTSLLATTLVAGARQAAARESHGAVITARDQQLLNECHQLEYTSLASTAFPTLPVLLSTSPASSLGSCTPHAFSLCAIYIPTYIVSTYNQCYPTGDQTSGCAYTASTTAVFS